MQKFEYITLPQWDEESLNNLGNDGWKLISVTGNHGSTNHTAVLMREVPEETDGTSNREKEPMVPQWPVPFTNPFPPLQTPNPPLTLMMNCVWCNGTGRITQFNCTAPWTTCNMCHGTGKANMSGAWPTQVTSTATGTTQYTEETFIRGNGSTLVESLKPTEELSVANDLVQGEYPERIIIDEPTGPITDADFAPKESVWKAKEADLGYGVKELRERYSTKPTISENNISEIPAPQENFNPVDKIPENIIPIVPDILTEANAAKPAVVLADQDLGIPSTLVKKTSHRGWTPDQMRSFYKTIARMSLKGPQLVPFVHGGYLYRPEPRPKAIMTDLAKSVVEVAETKADPAKVQYKTNYESILAEVKAESEAEEAWKNQANTGNQTITPGNFLSAKVYVKEGGNPPIDPVLSNIKIKSSTLFQDVLDYSKPNKSLDEVKEWLAKGNLTFDGSDYEKQRAWVGNTVFESSWYKFKLEQPEQQYFPDMVFNPDAWGKQNNIPADYGIREINSNGVLGSQELESGKPSMKEYYSLPTAMEDMLNRSGYRDSATVSVRWNDIKTVVEKLGVQAPVIWQEDIKIYHWEPETGYAATMGDLRDAKQTMLDLGTLYSPDDLTESEKLEEHIEQDWEALAKVYPADVAVAPYYDEFDPNRPKKYARQLWKPSKSVETHNEEFRLRTGGERSELPSDQAETIENNPKSWAAWKREAERLKALLVSQGNLPDDDCGC